MLLAGAWAHSTPARGGALTFSIDSPPSDTLGDGSANKYFKYKNKKTEYTILGILRYNA